MGPKYRLEIKLTIPGKGDYIWQSIEPTVHLAYGAIFGIVIKLYYNETKIKIDPIIRDGTIKISDENQIGTYEIEEIK